MMILFLKVFFELIKKKNNQVKRNLKAILELRKLPFA